MLTIGRRGGGCLSSIRKEDIRTFYLPFSTWSAFAVLLLLQHCVVPICFFLFYCALPDTYQRLKAAGLYQWDGSVSPEIFSSLTQVWKNILLMIDFPHKGIFSYTYLSVQIVAPTWNDSLCLTAALCMDELAHFSKKYACERRRSDLMRSQVIMHGKGIRSQGIQETNTQCSRLSTSAQCIMKNYFQWLVDDCNANM